jgi:hypothetical protein
MTEADILATAKSVRSRGRTSGEGGGYEGGGWGGGTRDEGKVQLGSGPVLVVMFCGGVTFAETRLAYALSKVYFYFYFYFLFISETRLAYTLSRIFFLQRHGCSSYNLR